MVPIAFYFMSNQFNSIYSSTYNVWFDIFSDRDEGWVELTKNIEETLKKDLKIIAKSKSTDMDLNMVIAKQIGAFHAIDGYETLIMTHLDEKTNQYAFMRNATKLM